ncbi:MAG TPA: ankyrin repeat domain-containing protein [Gaiellaceae bacterium]|nr:ankyrin repeat domain-containing protein [Gaiellaceae bacterium]
MDQRTVVERFVHLAGERGGRAHELLQRHPEIRADPWVMLSLGDASAVRDAARPGGPLERPPLFYVARSRVADDTAAAARSLLERGADPNGPGGEDWTNLSIACARGDAPLARALLDAGARPDDNDSLYHSVEPTEDACLRLLLERGATVPGTNALHHALDYDRLEPVRLLLEHGGDPSESDDWPALHHAVLRGRSPAFLRLLVAHGADPAARDEHGRTAYRHAVRRGSADAAATLHELGSPTDLTDADRALNAIATGGPVDAAALDDDAPDVLIELAMTGAETLARVVDAVGPMFSARWGGGPRGTLLHQASWFGRVELVELLLRRGADPDAEVETEYATPLGWAAVGSRYSPDHPNDSFSAPDADYLGVARLLVDAGATVEPKDVEMAAPPLSEWLAGAPEAPNRRL